MGRMGHAVDVDAYLERIDADRPTASDLETLAALQYAHLVAVPFENLDIVFAGGVAHDLDRALAKVLGGRGGWCFELNGAFGLLLDALGFDVKLLGAAVLLDGPTTVIEHLALEVTGDGFSPRLVDVGFGDSFTLPIDLNRAGAQAAGPADFELIASPQGTTLARHVDDRGPAAQYRFKRVAHRFDDFAAVAASMQVDPLKHWSRKPFATRLLGTGADRVTLTHDTLKLCREGVTDERPVERAAWDGLLREWFDIERPGPWPD